MTPIEALLAALGVQVDIVQLVRTDQLTRPTPCDGWTVREVLNHSLGVTSKFTAFASGATDAPRTPSGDLVSTDHRATTRRHAEAARAAWTTTDMSRRCTLPFGSFTAHDAAGINLFDVLAHTWDLATATNLELDAPDELWQTGLDAAHRIIGPNRDHRHYAPALPVAEHASQMTRFLCYLGRQPPDLR